MTAWLKTLAHLAVLVVVIKALQWLGMDVGNPGTSLAIALGIGAMQRAYSAPRRADAPQATVIPANTIERAA